MLRNIALIFILFSLSGCVEGLKGYFKKSANNKWIDTKGFHGSKRAPLYNKKYISIAKKNILEGNQSDEDEEEDIDGNYEVVSPAKANQQMYADMIKRDEAIRNRQRFEEHKSRYRKNIAVHPNEYVSLQEGARRTGGQNIDVQDLQDELSEIKYMLREARRDLVKYKCPLDEVPKPKVRTRVSPASNSSSTRLKEKFIQQEDHY